MTSMQFLYTSILIILKGTNFEEDNLLNIGKFKFSDFFNYTLSNNLYIGKLYLPILSIFSSYFVYEISWILSFLRLSVKLSISFVFPNEYTKFSKLCNLLTLK